jgi:hypothetical protein
MNRKQKHELLAIELENKKLDVEIKEAQLIEVKVNTEQSRQRIAKADALIGHLKYQESQIDRQRTWIAGYQKDLARLSKDYAELTRERNFVQDDLRNVREKLSELRNTRAVRFVRWVENLFDTVFSPAPKLAICVSVPADNEAKVAWQTTKVGNIRNVNKLSPEILAMSADEFKQKYIDTITL